MDGKYKSARVIFGLMLIVAALFYAAPAAGGPGELRVVASGVRNISENPMEARSSAFSEALRAALEQAVGRLVLPETLGKFYPLVAEELLLKPSSYISGYGVVAESQADGLIRVTVSATIPLAPLRDALERLGVFVPEAQRPEVLVAVAERPDEENAFSRWWTAPRTSKPQTLPFSERLASVLAGRGLVVLPFKLGSRGFITEDDPVRLAQNLGAAAAIVGEVTLGGREGPNRSGFANLEVVSTKGEGLIMSINVSEETPTEEERPLGWSIARALADRIGPQIATRLRDRFSVAKSATKQITLGLTGLSSLKQYQMVKRFLSEKVPQVKSVKEKTVGPGRALMVVDTVGGDAPAIKEALAGARLNGYTFKVREISPHVLEVELVTGPHHLD